MPGVKRREVQTRSRALTGLALMRFAMNGGSKAVYEANREALLRHGNAAPLHVQAFWIHEPGVPDELRPDPHDDEMLPEDGGSWGPAVARAEALGEARRDWLAVNRERLLGGAE